jgi:DNA modification methylase
MEAETIYVEVTQIKVAENLARVRTDLGKIKELAASLKQFGQLQPIVINRNYELIAGGRRLEACREANIKALVIFKDTVDPLRMREMELEENIQRKSLNPSEELMAVAELHRLKQSIHGETTFGPNAKGWDIGDTANSLGRDVSGVAKDLLLAKALAMFPGLAECKTKSEMQKAVKALTSVQTRLAGLEKFEESAKNVEQAQLIRGDALDHLSLRPDESVDVLFTDPPYGIDIGSLQMGLGGETGNKLNTAGFSFDDSEERALLLYAELARESFRFVKPGGFALVFIAPSMFPKVRLFFSAVGWDVGQRPFVWVKRESGQNNQPDRWFSSCYEMILFARKEESKLVIQGQPDWIQCDPVSIAKKVHTAEKPVQLIKELLSRCAYPGSVVFDPFMGSGSTIEAALELRMQGIGVELGIEAYSAACERIAKWKENKGAKP